MRAAEHGQGMRRRSGAVAQLLRKDGAGFVPRPHAESE